MKNETIIDERDRRLLFGEVALSLRLVTADELERARSAFSRDPSLSLEGMICGEGEAGVERRALIEKLVDWKIQDSGNDASAALSAFVSSGGSYATALVRGSLDATARTIDAVNGTLPLDGDEAVFADSGDRNKRPGLVVDPETRYTIKSEQGRGQIGVVSLAVDEHIGREVALKELLVYNDDFDGGPKKPSIRAMDRFLREARITAQLNHPSIVPVYDIANRSGGAPYYTMRLVRGKTMGDTLSGYKDISERLQMLPAFLDICYAMAYAHSQGVIHRDLKPDNVLIGKYGETVVLDWGLAKARGVADISSGKIEVDEKILGSGGIFATVAGHPLGTPCYMSPEQAQGRIDDVNERSDVWSLGAILYELLTGRPPFLGGNAFEVIKKVIRDPLRPIEELCPEAPPELQAIAGKCLEKDPLLRYANAGEVADDVAEVVQVLFGPMSFIQVREEKNQAIEARRVAEEQRKIAEEQRELAQARELIARKALAEAYYQYGLRAEQRKRWNDARVYFAKAMFFDGREEARSGLAREAARPMRFFNRVSIKAHEDEVTAARFSGDGKLLATGGKDKTAKIWRVKDGSPTGVEMKHDDWVNDLDFSPDAKRVITCSSEAIFLWNAQTGEMIRRISGHESEVSGVRFTPDGQKALSSSLDLTLKLWDLDSGECLFTMSGHEDMVTCLDISSDSSLAASGGWDKSVRIWSLKTGALENVLAGHGDEVNSVAFDGQGKTLVSAGADGAILVWDLTRDFPPPAELPGDSEIKAVSVGPGGTILAAESSGWIGVWPGGGGEKLCALRGHSGGVEALHFSGDGKLAVSAGADGAARLWEIVRSNAVTEYRDRAGEISAAAFSPDGKAVASSGQDRKIRVHFLGRERKDLTLSGHEAPVSSLSFSPRGDLLASGSWDDSARLWSLSDGQCVAVCEGHEGGGVMLAEFKDGGEKLLTVSYDNLVKLWSSSDGSALKTYRTRTREISSARYCEARDVLLVGSCARKEGLRCLAGETSLHALAHDEPMGAFAGHADAVRCVAVSADGKRAITGGGDSLLVWDGETGRTLRELRGHKATLRAVDASADGSRAVSGDDDGAIKLWDLETGACLLTFAGHEGPVLSVRFAPDGKSFVSGSKDKTTRVWRIPEDLLDKEGEDIFETAGLETGMVLDGFFLAPRK